VAVVDVISDQDAADSDVLIQRTGHAHEHQHIEAFKLMKRRLRDKARVAVPLGRDGMDCEPIPIRIGKAAILIEFALVADQRFRIRKVSLYGVSLARDGRKDESTPGMGPEFCLHVGWSAVFHSLDPWADLIRA
jgi:hypothetical protein